MRCDTAHDLLLPLKLTYVTTAAWLRHSKYTRARTQSGPGDCVRACPRRAFCGAAARWSTHRLARSLRFALCMELPLPQACRACDADVPRMESPASIA
jgi:hypothetical protein